MKLIDGTFKCVSDGMFENLDDHHTFWHCANGNAYLKYCPAKLIWSQIEQLCVWNGKHLIKKMFTNMISQIDS